LSNNNNEYGKLQSEARQGSLVHQPVQDRTGRGLKIISECKKHPMNPGDAVEQKKRNLVEAEKLYLYRKPNDNIPQEK